VSLFGAIILESFWRSLSTILNFTLIMLPIMIFLEYIRHYNLLEKISAYFYWLTRLLTLPPGAVFPLLVGLFIGILNGAAVIVEYGRQGILSKRDLMLIGVFLAVNHSIIEDNLLLASLGANPGVLILARFLLAFLLTRGMAFWLDRNRLARDSKG
jgi:hypothetical protein